MRHNLILGEEAEGGLLNGQRLAAEKNRSHMVLVVRSSNENPNGIQLQVVSEMKHNLVSVV